MVASPLAAMASAAVLSIGAVTAVAPAAPSSQASCAWRITAVHVLAELTGDTTPRSEQLRQALIDVGANRPGFVPEQCATASDSGSGGSASNQDQSKQGNGSTGSGSGSGSGDAAQGSGSQGTGSGGGEHDGSSQQGSGQGTTGQGTTGRPGSGGQGSGGQGATAAEAFGWGEPDKVDDFNDLSGWNIYDGPGHAGNGTRSPEAASVADGLLTINGTGDGTTAGMAWGDGQKYGRWEGRMKAPKGSPSYNALFLLWPTEENFPVGGEVDFAEITDAAREKVNLFLHYGGDNQQVQGDVAVDATQWHNWAVEWTPQGVTTFLDGKRWWHTDDTSILPPGPMHLCIQLDWFPKGDNQTGQMQVDWVKQWSLNGAQQSSPAAGGGQAPGPKKPSSPAGSG